VVKSRCLFRAVSQGVVPPTADAGRRAATRHTTPDQMLDPLGAAQPLQLVWTDAEAIGDGGGDDILLSELVEFHEVKAAADVPIRRAPEIHPCG